MTIPFDALYRDPQEPIALRVADLLNRMTPLEKARQLDQYFGTGFLDRTHSRMVTVAAEGALRTDTHDGNGMGALLGWSLDESDFQQAVQAARDADVAVVVLGDSERTCGEGIDCSELTLPGRQRELLQAVTATGTPVVLVLQNGRALTLDWESAHVNAIVEAWYDGERAGQAVAEVLLGLVNPSGKLPVSFPKSVGHLPCYYYRPQGGRTAYIEGESNPLYAFGHGLSYTAFEHGDLRLSSRSSARRAQRNSPSRCTTPAMWMAPRSCSCMCATRCAPWCARRWNSSSSAV